MTTASAVSVPSEQEYEPLGLVGRIPCTTREQWVALLPLVVVYVSLKEVHILLMIPELL